MVSTVRMGLSPPNAPGLKWIQVSGWPPLRQGKNHGMHILSVRYKGHQLSPTKAQQPDLATPTLQHLWQHIYHPRTSRFQRFLAFFGSKRPDTPLHAWKAIYRPLQQSQAPFFVPRRRQYPHSNYSEYTFPYDTPRYPRARTNYRSLHNCPEQLWYTSRRPLHRLPPDRIEYGI